MRQSIITLRPSAVLAAVTTEYGISYEDTRASGTCTSTTTNKLVSTSSNFTTSGVAVGDIIKNTVSGKFALVTAVDSATALSVSADVFADTDTFVIYTNHGYKLDRVYDMAVATLDVTATATDAGDTLDVYVDTSFDGGSTWVNIGHFTQVLGNGGAKRFIMAFKAAPIAASNSVSATADQAASAALQIGFGDRIRYRAGEVNTSTADSSFTFSLKMLFR